MILEYIISHSPILGKNIYDKHYNNSNTNKPFSTNDIPFKHVEAQHVEHSTDFDIDDTT